MTRNGAGCSYGCCSQCHSIFHRFWAGGYDLLETPRAAASCAGRYGGERGPRSIVGLA